MVGNLCFPVKEDMRPVQEGAAWKLGESARRRGMAVLSIGRVKDHVERGVEASSLLASGHSVLIQRCPLTVKRGGFSCFCFFGQ